MNNWLIVSLLLCIFGFLKELRPSEPFIYEFLIGEWRNITDEEVNQQVYPTGIYSYLSLLIIVFLITDLTRYKPLIIFLGLSGIVVWSMLLWTKEVRELIILEVFYGSFMACEVAYYTYIYAKVDKEYFQQVTSHTRAAILAGRTISGILGQVLISYNVMDFRQLNYITLGAISTATAWSLFLPSVKKSIYFHQEEAHVLTLKEKWRYAFFSIWKHFKYAYSNKYTLKWSIWWSLSTCGFMQVQIYMQPLWTEIVNDHELPIYNGYVEACCTILGFLGALLAGYLKLNWEKWGELALSCCSLIQGTVLFLSSYTSYVEVSYVSYVIFGGLYQFLITIASTEIAKKIHEDSYGLIMGINTFLALAIQTVLVVIVVSGDLGFGLTPRHQYFVYGVFHVLLGVLYIIIGTIGYVMNRYRNPEPQNSS
ncbi:thiamine transporter 1-like [Anthonomus grandis grandis]|uniref:thiamine transporter 1-like n=1 Tax=Anthonomus grandis grandis TaxID=2921223 RepID=UPI0021651495|nr:thiamine transporter 1-like [Anthonomus grandis grandis]XP_050305718.1 thiamine transporter 1-like [Anthonomus grandis grandis]XP_050305719.1 thiamine transporter 1-like [Anthonomus grandis grandis]XP_050305721.1 thiamine transporter 1-like [Anthonomus grandis grandis]